MPKQAKLATKFRRPVDSDAEITFGWGENDNEVDAVLNAINGTPTDTDWIHLGTDYDYDSRLPEDMEVVAVANGTVLEVGIDDGSGSGYGNYVILEHKLPNKDIVYSFYAHMAEPPLVEVDDIVDIGEQLGIVGDTGTAVGAHLHFEVRFSPNFTFGGPQSGSYDTVDQFSAGTSTGFLFDPDEFVLNYLST